MALEKAQNNHCSCTMSTLKTLLTVSIFCSDLYQVAGHQGNERHQGDWLISCHFTILHTRKWHKLTIGANMISYCVIFPAIYLKALHWVPGCRDRSTGVSDEVPCPCSVDCEKKQWWNNEYSSKKLFRHKSLMTFVAPHRDVGRFQRFWVHLVALPLNGKPTIWNKKKLSLVVESAVCWQ